MIDGRSLIGLMAAYESARGYSPAGGYGGVIPDSSAFDDLLKYYLGTAPSQLPRPGWSWLLARERCGVADCWSLEAMLNITDETVAWSDFRQPHRPSWDYSGFGSFRFDR